MAASREDELRRELLTRELSDRENNSSLQKASFFPTSFKGGIENFNKTFENTIVDPALGAIQGTVNFLPGLANLPIQAINALTGSNVPQVKYFDEAPHTTGSQFGELASVAGGPGLLRYGANIGRKALEYVPQIAKNPIIERGIENAKNIFNKLPISNETAKNIGTGALIGAGYEHEHPILGAIGGAAIPIGIRTGQLAKEALYRPNVREIGKSIQQSHDNLENYAVGLFDKVAENAYARNIAKVPVDQEIINLSEKYLPSTDASRKLITDASTGDYKALRDLQSDLWQEGTAGLKSTLRSEQKEGKEILDLRDRLNNSIFNHLDLTGNKDLSAMLKEGMNNYKILKETYFGDFVPNSIKKLVHPKSRKIPKNLMNVLSEESEPMEQIKSMNPLVEENLQNLLTKQNALKKLKYLGIGTGAALGVSSLPTLYNKAKQVGNILTR